jgi:hypothetical protein
MYVCTLVRIQPRERLPKAEISTESVQNRLAQPLSIFHTPEDASEILLCMDVWLKCLAVWFHCSVGVWIYGCMGVRERVSE